MIVYRLTKEKWKDDISGNGARNSDNRWNSRGISMLYTSQSAALCVAEIAVHFRYEDTPVYYLQEIKIPDDLSVKELEEDEYPTDWQEYPHSNSTREIGDKFVLDEEYPVMKVKSSIVPVNYNYLINPRHSDFNKIRLIKSESFELDPRLRRN